MMRELRHPITVFIVAVLVVIGIGVGVLAGTTTTPSHLARPVVTPASFLSPARLGIEGTFSAVYKLSARHRTPRATPLSLSHSAQPPA
jgi:hypothetical protein